MTRWLLLSLVLLLAGCSITQEVKPVALVDVASREICVIQNKSVRDEFLQAYRQAL
jgi:uncharacterized lipoprotein YmbA